MWPDELEAVISDRANQQCSNGAVMSIDGPNKASEQSRLVLPLSFMFFHYATYCDFLYIISLDVD